MTRPNCLPPGPRSRIPGGVFADLRRDPLDFLTRITQIHGDISSFRALNQRYVILNHPDLARDVLLTHADAFWKGPALQNSRSLLGDGLLTAEGDTHRDQRRIMTPAFHARHVETYAADIIACTRDLHAHLEPLRAAGPIDIRPAMARLTLTIAGRTLFGALLDEDAERVRLAMETLMANYIRTIVPWGRFLNALPLSSTRKLRAAQRDLHALIDRIITARRAAAPADHHDLLATLIAAADPATAGNHRLTDRQLRDQAITILTASHETTANALTFTLYLLARHPEEQRKLQAEIDTALPDRDPAAPDLTRLPRTRWAIAESLRLYPPAWTLGRQNQREITLRDFTLPPKCTVLIPQWTLHRDPRFFPDPLAFTPERWRVPQHPRFAYLPFSTGPRNCIGESFAWLEMMLALAMLLRRYEFTLHDPAAPLRLHPAITLRPARSVLLRLAPRNPPEPPPSTHKYAHEN